MKTPKVPMPKMPMPPPPGKKRPDNWPNAKGQNNLVPPMAMKPKAKMPAKKAC